MSRKITAPSSSVRLFAILLFVIVVTVACESESDRRKDALAEWIVDWDAVWFFHEEQSELMTPLNELESPWTGKNGVLFNQLVSAYRLSHNTATLENLLKDKIGSVLGGPDDFFMCREGFFIEGVMDGGYPPDADSLFARARVDEDELLRVCSLRSQAFTNLVQVNMLFENYLLEDEIEKAKTKRCAATESPSESESLRLPYWNCPVP